MRDENIIEFWHRQVAASIKKLDFAHLVEAVRFPGENAEPLTTRQAANTAKCAVQFLVSRNYMPPINP